MEPVVIAVTGPSGFNKMDIVKKARLKNPDFGYIISYTTQENVPELYDGDFKIVSEEEFDSMIYAEKFIEWQRLISNNYKYGKTKKDFDETIKNTKCKVLFTIINVINLPVLKRYYPKVKSLFIDVKDTKALIEFLKNSPDANTPEEYEKRLKFATEERRRRHLADITIKSQDDDEIDMKNFLDAVEKLKNL
jgi:guanylate kinase